MSNLRRPAWTYKKLTEETEAQLRWYAEFLQKQLAKATDHRDRVQTELQINSWAHGAVSLWDKLTSGWQQPGDEARLKALVDSMLTDE